MTIRLSPKLTAALTEIDRHLEQGDTKQAEIMIARRLRRDDLDSTGRSVLLLRRARVRLYSENRMMRSPTCAKRSRWVRR